MDLLNVLENENLIKINDNYIKYKEIVKMLTKDFMCNNINEYRIERLTKRKSIIKINENKEIKYEKNVDKSIEKVSKITISNINTTLILNYNIFDTMLFHETNNYKKSVEFYTNVLIGKKDKLIQLKAYLSNKDHLNYIEMISTANENETNKIINSINDIPELLKKI